MRKRFHLFKGGRTVGPYSAGDLRRMLADGKITRLDLVRADGDPKVRRIGEIFDAEPEATAAAETADSDSGEGAADRGEDPEPQSDPAARMPEPDPPSDLEDDDGEDDDVDGEDDDQAPDETEEDEADEEGEDENDDDDEAKESIDDEPAGEDEIDDDEDEDEGEDEDPNDILYQGHPSVFAYPKSLIVAVAASAIGAFFSLQQPLFLAAGIFASALIFTAILFLRSYRVYLVTSARVEVVVGILSRSSREVRIDDIRAINVNKIGLLGFIGVGTVEFCTAGSDGVEVAFQQIHGAHRVKTLVRSLRDG
ncbi:MAG: PH domain-containing protein [Verrucomicrobiales bacterium]